MLESQRHTIGTIEVEITQVPALKASRGLIRLSRVLGAALADVSGLTKDEKEIEAQAEKILMVAIGKLEDTEIEWFARFFEPHCFQLVRLTADDEPKRVKLSLEKHFTHSLKDLLTWIMHCVSLNYLSFLGDFLPPGKGTGGGNTKTEESPGETVSVSESF